MSLHPSSDRAPMRLLTLLPEVVTDVAAAALADEQLTDVAAELANMLCGALLTRADRNQHFELLPPQVTRGMGVGREGWQVDETQFFSVNDRPMVVHVATA